jgi:deazaflavin-dependent oxidoreductase (nitroreductase family)
MAGQIKRVSYFTVTLYTLTGGRLPRSSESDPVGFLELTTIGRKSGQPRTVTLLYIRSNDAYVVTASNAGRETHPAWFYNLRANPQVTIRVHNQRRSAVAEVASPAQRSELWARLIELAPMYKGYEKRTKREIPMVLLRPTDASGE